MLGPLTDPHEVTRGTIKVRGLAALLGFYPKTQPNAFYPGTALHKTTEAGCILCRDTLYFNPILALIRSNKNGYGRVKRYKCPTVYSLQPGIYDLRCGSVSL
jgi:hypothetical protein